MKFTNFDFTPSLQEALDIMGFSEATPIQKEAIPHILEGKDVLACAQTGTGKTAAFVLPILHKLSKKEHNLDEVNTLIIAPTRELVMQIDQQIDGFSYFTNTSSIAVYGGGDGAEWVQQKNAIQQGVDILVATPGRLIALLNSKHNNLDHVQHLILDEADRMLDMGFSEDIDRIVSQMPKERQTLLFSATFPPKIRQLANKRLKEPVEISLSVSKPAAGVDQKVYMAYDGQKNDLISHLLKQKEYKRVIVFASTKDKVKSLSRELKALKYNIKSIHSDLDQKERNEIMSAFKAMKVQVLIGTDIISRGIDVENVELVVNYDVPSDPEDYVHRVGRTARAETTGEAITFVNEKDQFYFSKIESLIERKLDKIQELPEGIGKGPDYNERSARPTRNFRSKKGEGFKKNKNRYNKNRNFKGKDNRNQQGKKGGNQAK